MPIASIRISKESKVIHGWYIHPIPYEMTIKDFFVKLTTGELSPEYNIDIIDPETIDSAEISKTQDATTTQCHGGGWFTQSYADTQGKQFVNCLTETIWYIDMRDHKKFKDRSYHIPKLFLKFFGRANPELYKQSRKPFDANELNLHCKALAPYATSSWILKENFNWLRDDLDNFIVAISNYAGFLQRQREITAANHASETSIRTVDQSTTIQIHMQNFWVTPVDKYKYYNLEQLLTDLPLWKPVDLEEFLPMDPVYV
ncbi:hypothetical protein C2G38_2038956 [Gigaspora rosea]|uniref:Uncharacterized protein n=1 Tax=Gigaspora rosea TaxID=44941 RepID=A0A397V2X8_9GLOM|nr:hypothetical protein C2G38_2038956 [Gigaspora rosea]